MTNALGPAVTDWTSREWRAPALVGRTVTLEPLAPAHGDALADALLAQPPDHWDYLPYGPFADRAAFDRHLETLPDVCDGAYAIVVAGEPVGIAAYLRNDPANGVVEVGHLSFGTALQRTPASTEALSLMIRHAFELGYRRVEWKCNDLNVPSKRAAERLGFTYEGTFRQHLVVKGHNRDTAWFSILDSEWPGVSARHEAWLDPSNFDSAGTQRAPLQR